MKTFELVAGKHYEDIKNAAGVVIETKVHKAPKRIRSDMDLEKMFPEKFRLLSEKPTVKEPEIAEILKPGAAAESKAESSPAAKKPTKSAKKSEEPEEPAETKATEGDKSEVSDEQDDTSASPLGEDVTEDFPTAAAADMRVFKKGTEYFVTESDEPDVAKNPEPLKRQGVAKFIASYLED